MLFVYSVDGRGVKRKRTVGLVLKSVLKMDEFPVTFLFSSLVLLFQKARQAVDRKVVCPFEHNKF